MLTLRLIMIMIVSLHACTLPLLLLQVKALLAKMEEAIVQLVAQDKASREEEGKRRQAAEKAYKEVSPGVRMLHVKFGSLLALADPYIRTCIVNIKSMVTQFSITVL